MLLIKTAKATQIIAAKTMRKKLTLPFVIELMASLERLPQEAGPEALCPEGHCVQAVIPVERATKFFVASQIWQEEAVWFDEAVPKPHRWQLENSV